MTYTVYRDTVRPAKYKSKSIAAALIVAVAALFMVGMHAATVAAVSAHMFEFTQTELDDNWDADRRAPSGGYGSVSALNRDNVVQLNIDSDETDSSQFHRTEGIKTSGNFGQAVQADLYLDAAWDEMPVRAGLWANGMDERGAADGPWGIIEFTTAGADDFTGWRIWTSGAGWTNMTDVSHAYGEWATLKIALDAAEQEYNYYINGAHVHTGDASSMDEGNVTHFHDVVLNSYNYGLEGGSDYSAHWHGGLANPQDRQECMVGGWTDYGFSNQGLCIQYVNTGRDSR